LSRLFRQPDAEEQHLYPLRAANVISIMANEQTGKLTKQIPQINTLNNAPDIVN